MKCVGKSSPTEENEICSVTSPAKDKKLADQEILPPAALSDKHIMGEIHQNADKKTEREISPSGWQTNLRAGLFSPLPKTNPSSLRTPTRYPAKDYLHDPSETKRLSRQNFDTKQYRSDNKSSALEKRKGTCKKPEMCDENLSELRNGDCVSELNSKICAIMNEFYNSPAMSKANIPRILNEVSSYFKHVFP